MTEASLALTIRSYSAEKRSATFVASSAAVDSYGEIVEQSWKLERYLSNPVVLFGHDSRALPIGRADSVGMVDGCLECTVVFASKEANPLAEQVWQSVQEKTLRAVSVGFVPGTIRTEKRDGQDIYVLADNDLHEISVVPIPANPEALAKMRARAKQQTTPGSAPKEKAMDPKELEAKLVQREADVRAAEKHLADERTKTKALEAQNAALVTERDAAIARAKKADGDLVALEVDALVWKKITLAERDMFVELAVTSRPLFEKMVAQRTDMKLLGAPVLPDDKLPPPAPTTGATGAGEDLAALLDS